MIKCLVCGKAQKLITPAHLRTHGLTADEYKARFPGAPMSSRAFRRRRAEVMTERWQDPDNLERLSESCRRVQLAAWEGNDERRAQQAARAPAMVARIWADPEKRQQMSERRRRTALELWQRPDYRQAHLTERKLRWLSEEYRKRARGGPIGRQGRAEDLGDTWFRSTWERNLARILNLQGESWQYEPRAFHLSSGHSYTPDFFLPNRNLYLEVKGWESDEWLEKLLLFCTEYPEVHLYVISACKYEQLRKKYQKQIPLWETPLRKPTPPTSA